MNGSGANANDDDNDNDDDNTHGFIDVGDDVDDRMGITRGLHAIIIMVKIITIIQVGMGIMLLKLYY